jgi:hypothetical protein
MVILNHPQVWLNTQPVVLGFAIVLPPVAIIQLGMSG